jgi:outer membrane biosynthesis protein TonB
MSEHRTGLHKEVSAIFNGVSLPKNNGTQLPSAAPAPGHQDSIATKPPAPEPPTQKPPAPSHMTPTKPKPQQPPAQPFVQPPPEAAPAKQPKANAAIKTARQIPWQRTLEQIKNKLFAPKPGVSTTRQKMTVIAVPALFIVLIFVFVRVFSTPSRKITGPGTFGPTKAAASSDSKIDWQAPALYPTTLRDPMRFGSATGETGGLIVKGILYSKDNPSAVIGSQIVHEGDKVLDVVIVKINEDSVEFEANGKKWTQKVQR